MWSTNFNVGIQLLMRLPCPNPATFPEQALADAVDDALRSRAEIESQIQGAKGRFADGVVRLDLDDLLARNPQIRKTKLADAEFAGTVTVAPGRSGKVSKILEQGRLDSPHEDYRILLERFLEDHGDDQWDVLKEDIFVPRHDATDIWMRTLAEEEERAVSLAQAFSEASRRCDDLVFEWYGFDLQGELRKHVDGGLPWQYQNARRRYAELVGTREGTADVQE
jgi:hypothetical protein